MNRSRRRAPVIAWAITVGVLYGTVGIGNSATAGADDSGPGPSIGEDADPAGIDSSGPHSEPRRHGRHNDEPRRHGRHNDETASGNTGGGGATDGGGRPAPCPWWPRPLPPNRPITGGDNGGNSGLIATPAVVPTVPVAVFGDRVAPVVDIDALPEELPSAPAAVATPPAAPPGMLPRARTVPVPAAPRPPAPAAVPAPPMRPPAAKTPPAAPAPPPQHPGAGVDPTAPVRLGYPDDLRDADLARAISLALPGLAALAGMTALGGLVGYRQARAGYLLRVAGAGRFLQ